MRHKPFPHRPGMTALAAVIAFSSTPLFAQSADPAPVIVPPTPTAAQPDAVPVVTPPAPAQPTQTQMPVAATLNIPHTPVTLDEPTPASTATVEPAARPKPTLKTSSAKPRATAKETSPVVPPAPRMAEVQPPAQAVQPTPAPTAAESVPASSTPQVRIADDDVLPVAGAAGLALLALGGGAYAFTRRKRETSLDAADSAVTTPMAAPETDPPAEPLVVSGPALTQASSATSGLAREVPAGFDMTRYGRHVQAAYRGPTPDNPSLSLSKRLKRARFFDQRERMGSAAQPDMRPGISSAAAAVRTEAPKQDRAKFTAVQPGTKRKPSFRPALQS